MASFLFRLWAHEAEDGLLPEVVVTADTRMQAAALALRHFVSRGRPIGLRSYLECEPAAGKGLRVIDVLTWLNQQGTDVFWLLDEELDPVATSINYTDRASSLM